MSIKLYLPDRLVYLAKGKALFEVNGTTVGECLDALVSLIPVMRKTLFYDTEKALKPTITVRVNKKSLDTAVLAKDVRDGDEIHIEMKTH